MWLVGAGYWGSKLVENLKKFNVSATTIDIKNGQTIGDITDLGPVILATPLWQHYEQTMQLIQKGHDVYVEKPLARTAQEIMQIRSVKSTDQLLMVGHIFVHHPQMELIKNIIADGSIGQLKHITSRRLNWGIYQTQTDPILSLATHDISIIETLTQNLITVEYARGWNYSNNQQPDRVYFSGKINDITYDIDVSWYWPVRIRETIIIGDQGQITWNQDNNTVSLLKNQIINNRAIVDTNPKLYSYDYELSPLECELNHWLGSIDSRTEPMTGLEQAYSVARVIDDVKLCLR